MTLDPEDAEPGARSGSRQLGDREHIIFHASASDPWMRLPLECDRERADVSVALASSGFLCSPTNAAAAMAAAAG